MYSETTYAGVCFEDILFVGFNNGSHVLLDCKNCKILRENNPDKTKCDAMRAILGAGFSPNSIDCIVAVLDEDHDQMILEAFPDVLKVAKKLGGGKCVTFTTAVN